MDIWIIFKNPSFSYFSKIISCLYTRRRSTYNHKWCVHSILPLALRVKQPVFIITRVLWQESIWSCYHGNTKTLTTLGCGTRPVSIGSRRWRAECTEHLGAVSVRVCVRLRWGVGGNILSTERVQKPLQLSRDATWANNANMHWFL
jgi:hypothetical protein